MVTKNTKSIIDTVKLKTNEHIHSTKEIHQSTIEETKNKNK